MRRLKEPEVRKNEILDAAHKLFVEKGYSKTTVIDILNVNGLSKGVFYYYFKSKEEVLDAIIERIVDAEVANAKKIVADPDLTTPQKLFAILTSSRKSPTSMPAMHKWWVRGTSLCQVGCKPHLTSREADSEYPLRLGQGQPEQDIKEKEDIINQFHIAENAEMQQKSLVQTIKHLAPVIAEIIYQDKEETFKTDYPQETVAFFLAAGQLVLDQDLFQWKDEGLIRYAKAFVELMEKTLGVERGYFDDVKKMLT
ncbi:MAG: TetR/AcrR family transcriptional regulator [Lachnospiraceae bacterium]